MTGIITSNRDNEPVDTISPLSHRLRERAEKAPQQGLRHIPDNSRCESVGESIQDRRVRRYDRAADVAFTQARYCSSSAATVTLPPETVELPFPGLVTPQRRK